MCIDSCVNGDVRLIGSTISNGGRVELCVRREWTSICDRNWDLYDAKVMCRQLGYSTYGMTSYI